MNELGLRTIISMYQLLVESLTDYQGGILRIAVSAQSSLPRPDSLNIRQLSSAPVLDLFTVP